MKTCSRPFITSELGNKGRLQGDGVASIDELLDN